MRITCKCYPTPYPDTVAEITFETSDVEFVMCHEKGGGTVRFKSGISIGIPDEIFDHDDNETLILAIQRQYKFSA